MLLVFFKSIVTAIMRRAFWMLQMFRSEISANGLCISLPVIVEGKGKIIVGSNAKFGKRAALKCATTGSFDVGANSSFGTSSLIVVEASGKLVAGDNFSLQQDSQLRINNIWRFGSKVYIAQRVQIFSREPLQYGKVAIGDGCYIGDGCIIDVCDDVSIGNNVAVGAYSIFYTHDHDINNSSNCAWKGELKKGKIVIEDGSWIGSRVTILPGVTIGKRAVIAAGSVVTKNVPSNCVVAGVPAKVIRTIEHPKPQVGIES